MASWQRLAVVVHAYETKPMTCFKKHFGHFRLLWLNQAADVARCHDDMEQAARIRGDAGQSVTVDRLGPWSTRRH
jgi:hypothetical protein